MAENGNKGQFTPGDPRAGRPKGVPNKATTVVRDAISGFVDGKADQVQELWERVARKDPAKALEIYAKLAEFVLPKLSRSTIEGELGIRGKLVIND
jgi:hypothetical protein